MLVVKAAASSLFLHRLICESFVGIAVSAVPVLLDKVRPNSVVQAPVR